MCVCLWSGAHVGIEENEQSSSVELMLNRKICAFWPRQPFRWMLFDRTQKSTNEIKREKKSPNQRSQFRIHRTD